MPLPDTLTPQNLTQLLHMAVWAGLCAGVLAIWNVRWLRPIVVIHAALIGLLSATLIVWTADTACLHVVTMGRWLSLPGGTAIAIEQQFDEAALVFLLGVSVVVAVLASRRDREKTSEHRGLFWFVLYQAALQFVLMADFVLQLACWQLLSMAILLWVVGDASAKTPAIKAARRTFLFRFAADGVILLALLVGENHAAFGVLLVCGVIGRCCPFPFFSRDRFAGMPREAILADRLIVSPISVLLLGRLNLESASSDFAEMVLVFGGVGVASLAALTAASRNAHRLDMISLAITGLMLAGVGHRFDETAVLFLSHAVLITVAASVEKTPTRTSTAAWLLLGSGAGGQGLIIAAMLQEAEQNQSSVLWFALFLFGTTHLLTALAIGRQIRIQSTAMPASGLFTMLQTLIVAVLIGIVTLLSLRPVTTTSDDMAFPLSVLSGLIGMTAGWMTARSDEQSRTTGLIAEGFRLDRLFLRVCVLPVSFVAAFCRFAEWFIIEGLWTVPALVPRLFQHIDESLQTQSLRRSVCAVLFAAALLSAVIALGN